MNGSNKLFATVMLFGAVVTAQAQQPSAAVPMVVPPPQAGPEEIARNTMPIPYQILPDNRVTFRLKTNPNQNATSVKVEGDWPGGIRGRTTLTMTRGEQDIWSVTTPEPLPSDVWSFSFNVNGTRVNPSFGQADNGPILPPNVFAIPGSYGDDFIARGAPRGSSTYAHVPFMGATKDIEVYLPAEYYQNSNKRYPVIYITTGGAGVPNGPGTSAQWIMFDNLIASGRAVPMIVVTFMPGAPGGNSIGWANFEGAGNRTNQRYVDAADAIANELVPWVDRNFRTRADREHRAIGGFSSAGAQGFMSGARHVDKFANLFTFSGGYPTWPDVGVQIETKLDPKQYEGPDLNRIPDLNKLGAFIPKLNAAANMKLVALYCGTNEPLIQTHALMKQFMQERGVKFIATENPGQVHDGRNIRVSLHDLVPRLFK